MASYAYHVKQFDVAEFEEEIETPVISPTSSASPGLSADQTCPLELPPGWSFGTSGHQAVETGSGQTSPALSTDSCVVEDEDEVRVEPPSSPSIDAVRRRQEKAFRKKMAWLTEQGVIEPESVPTGTQSTEMDCQPIRQAADPKNAWTPTHKPSGPFRALVPSMPFEPAFENDPWRFQQDLHWPHSARKQDYEYTAQARCALATAPATGYRATSEWALRLTLLHNPHVSVPTYQWSEWPQQVPKTPWMQVSRW